MNNKIKITAEEADEDMMNKARNLYIAVGAVLADRRMDIVLSALSKHFVESCMEAGMDRDDFQDVVMRVFYAIKAQ